MIEKTLELRNQLQSNTAQETRFSQKPGILVKALTFLADTLFFNGHSICCVNREIYNMNSRSHWMR